MALIIGLLMPLLGTMLGAAFVFLMKDEMSPRLQKSLLGFASGVMVAASVWSLLIPAMEMEEGRGVWSVLPAAVGFLLGIGFLLVLDELTPHLHLGADTPEGPRSHLSRTAMLALAVTIHNLPEGMAVGVVFAGADQGAAGLSVASALAVSIGIAIQNVPVLHRQPERCRRANRWLGRRPAGFADDACPALSARFCCGRHVLRRRRGTYPRSLRRQAQQSQHHRLRHRFRSHDGSRRRAGLSEP